MDAFYAEINKHIEDSRRWNCKLEFPINDDGDVINLLDYAYDSYDNPITKCENPWYPKGCFFQFLPNKYNEQIGDNKLVQDITDCANKCGFHLVRKSRANKNVKMYKKSIDFYCARYFQYDARDEKVFNADLADGVKVQYFRNHKRLSVRADGKSLQKRTETGLSLSGERCCNFRFRIILGHDLLYYIKTIQVDPAISLDDCTIHTNHIHVPFEKRRTSLSQATPADIELIKNCDASGMSSQMTSELLHKSTKKKWLSSQINYVMSRKSEDIIEHDIQDAKWSSASKLIDYLSKQDDVTFITCVDTKHDGMQIRTKTKGRPTTNQTLEKDGNVSSYEQIVNELKLDGSPDILLAVGRLTDSKLRLRHMFP